MKPIKGYNNIYYITEDGEVYSCKINTRHGLYDAEPKLLKPYMVNGYKRINLTLDGKRKAHLIHRLVAETYIGDIKNKVVCHKDNNRTNCSVSNLYIGDQLMNMGDKKLSGYLLSLYKEGGIIPLTQPVTDCNQLKF